MHKYLKLRAAEYIFIFLTATIFLLISSTESKAEKNVFIIENVSVEGPVDLKFSRDKYINIGFKKSFNILMSKVLLSKDIDKIKNIKIKNIKNLINNFQIIEENYKNNNYEIVLKIHFSDTKVKKLLEEKNVSFSLPTNIDAIFFPVLFENSKMIDLNNFTFYEIWNSIKIKNSLVNFILPLEDLDDVNKLREVKKKIEDLNVDDFVNKYDVKNYVFALMEQNNNKFDVYLKTNFNGSKMSNNFSYKIDSLNEEKKFKEILQDLKMKITDLWKKENVINLSIPLSIRIKYEFKNLKDLEKLKENFSKINLIDKFSLEELNINHSFFQIYYYGNPKRLKNALLKFNYKLRNDQLHWSIYKND